MANTCVVAEEVPIENIITSKTIISEIVLPKESSNRSHALESLKIQEPTSGSLKQPIGEIDINNPVNNRQINLHDPNNAEISQSRNADISKSHQENSQQSTPLKNIQNTLKLPVASDVAKKYLMWPKEELNKSKKKRKNNKPQEPSVLSSSLGISFEKMKEEEKAAKELEKKIKKEAIERNKKLKLEQKLKKEQENLEKRRKKLQEQELKLQKLLQDKNSS